MASYEEYQSLREKYYSLQENYDSFCSFNPDDASQDIYMNARGSMLSILSSMLDRINEMSDDLSKDLPY